MPTFGGIVGLFLGVYALFTTGFDWAGILCVPIFGFFGWFVGWKIRVWIYGNL